jgi:hypothetical protein
LGFVDISTLIVCLGLLKLHSSIRFSIQTRLWPLSKDRFAISCSLPPNGKAAVFDSIFGSISILAVSACFEIAVEELREDPQRKKTCRSEIDVLFANAAHVSDKEEQLSLAKT